MAEFLKSRLYFVTPHNSAESLPRQHMQSKKAEIKTKKTPTSHSAMTEPGCKRCEKLAKNFLELERLLRINMEEENNCEMCAFVLKFVQTVNQSIVKSFPGSLDIKRAYYDLPRRRIRFLLPKPQPIEAEDTKRLDNGDSGTKPTQEARTPKEPEQAPIDVNPICPEKDDRRTKNTERKKHILKKKYYSNYADPIKHSHFPSVGDADLQKSKRKSGGTHKILRPLTKDDIYPDAKPAPPNPSPSLSRAGPQSNRSNEQDNFKFATFKKCGEIELGYNHQGIFKWHPKAYEINNTMPAIATTNSRVDHR